MRSGLNIPSKRPLYEMNSFTIVIVMNKKGRGVLGSSSKGVPGIRCSGKVSGLVASIEDVYINDPHAIVGCVEAISTTFLLRGIEVEFVRSSYPPYGGNVIATTHGPDGERGAPANGRK
jgi:hypothetical protein